MSEGGTLRLPTDPALRDGEMKAVEIEGEALLLCRIEGRYHAIRDACSHADQALSEGRLRGPTIYCPLHGARFDVRTGACLAKPATEPVASYAVEPDGEGLLFRRSPDES